MDIRHPLNTNIERLVGEALINPAFRDQLLTDPLTCARQLSLSEEETQYIVAARAATLREFAARLHHAVYGVTTG